MRGVKINDLKQTKKNMKRKIKFRGKRIDNGEWVYGGVFMFPEYNQAFIIEAKNGYVVNTEVNHETVGQFTGLKDKSDVDIYEGDVLERKYKYNNKDMVYKTIVSWSPQGYYAILDGSGVFECDISSFEIIGNIHENKELLNKKN